MKSLYLLINLLVIAGPLALSFDKKVAFYKNWKYLFPSILIMMLLFIPWDMAFTEIGVWAFNPSFSGIITIYNLPLGELLFFITVPYACVFIYECLNHYFPNTYKIKRPYYIIVALLIFSIIIYLANVSKLYTGYTAAIAAFVLAIQILNIKKYSFLGDFYRAFVVVLIPMFIIDGVLTGKPIVIYNELEKTSFRLGPIPWEDFLYNLIMLYLVIGFYELLKRKFGQKKVVTKKAA